MKAKDSIRQAGEKLRYNCTRLGLLHTSRDEIMFGPSICDTYSSESSDPSESSEEQQHHQIINITELS